MPSGCIDHAVEQSCVFSNEVNAKLICLLTNTLQVPTTKSLTDCYRMSSNSQQTHSITNGITEGQMDNHAQNHGSLFIY